MEELNATDLTGNGDATVSSTNTSLSGLTGYEEEFNDLKFLTRSTPTSPPYPKIFGFDHDSSKLFFETKLKNLTFELSNALKLNEKLVSSQKQQEEAQQARVKSLISKNAQLEAHLTVVRSHIEGLVKQCVASSESSILTRNTADLYEQIKIIQNAIIRCNSERNTSELLIRNIKSELESAKEEIQSRVACVNELKRKVSEQYASIEGVLQYNKELESRLKAAESELGWCKKSETWYKDQLHNARSRSMDMSQEIIKLQQIMVAKDQVIENLSLNLSQCKHNYEDLETTFKKERDCLLNRTETLQLEITSRTSSVDNTTSFCHNCSENNALQDVTHEIRKMKENIEKQTQIKEEVEKEKSNLFAQVMQLQRNLNEKESLLHSLEQQKIDMQTELFSKRLAEQNQNKDLLNLRGANDALKIKVAALQQEKMEVENAVRVIKQDLKKVMLAHAQLKQDVSLKEKVIVDLQKTVQELTGNDNKMKDLEQSARRAESLEERLKSVELEEAKSQQTIIELKNTITFLDDAVLKLERKYEAVVLEKEKVLQDLDEAAQRNASLTSLLETEKLKFVGVKQSNSELKTALKDKDAAIAHFMEQTECLKAEKISLQNQLSDVNKQLHLRRQEGCVQIFHEKDDVKNGRIDSPEFKLDEKSEEAVTEILELIFDRLQKIQGNTLCKEDVNIEIKTLSTESKSFLLLQEIMTKLFTIDRQIRKDFQAIPDQRHIQNILLGFSDFMQNKLQFVLDKCSIVDKKAQDFYQSLMVIKQKLKVTSAHSQEIVKLKAQELELKEKLKRYEINNHTLLRKVKEHMKARNAAEKQIVQLQTSYSAASADISLKKSELERSNLIVENLKAHIGDLQDNLLGLQKQVAELKVVNDVLKESAEEKETKVSNLERLLLDKETEIDNLKNLLSSAECQMEHVKALNAELSEAIRESRVNIKAAEETEKECEELREQLKNNEANFLKMMHKLNEAEDKQRKVESSAIEKNCDNLKNTTNKLRAEVQRLNNERWFLQRLCNDLKCALEASLKETEVLKAQRRCSGLPDLMPNLPPVPSKCDDVFIQELLKKSQASEVTLTAIEAPLKSLRRELNILRESVEEKCSF